MGKSRVIELPEDNTGEIGTLKLTNLEWSLQFVMLKIQEMVRCHVKDICFKSISVIDIQR